MSRILAGFDVGGSSIKAAPVDVDAGALAGDLETIVLPAPSTPDAVVGAIAASATMRRADGPIGLGFPSVIQRGVACTAANVDPSWIGVDAPGRILAATGRRCAWLNDADAAGLAEMRHGAGRGLGGVVFVLTFGTGIGSAPFVDGRLVPNTELGHLSLPGVVGLDAEQYASARTRTQLALGWEAWAERVDRYLAELHRLFWPDAFIAGGAVSEHFAEWGGFLRCPVPVHPARLRGAAGVIGAALAAADRYNP